MTNNHDFFAQITPENVQKYSQELNANHITELVEIIENKPPNEQVLIFSVLSDEKSAIVFEYLPLSIQKEILNALPPERVAKILNTISPDDRTALLEELPSDLVNQLLKFLTPEERLLSIKLLGYPEDSVGRLMTPDYIAIQLNWTVQQVLDYIRIKGHDSETIDIVYAVDDHGILVDDFRIRQLLLASPEIKVEVIADRKFIALHVNDDEEKAIEVFRKFARTALPVIDTTGHMLGIVTIDDIMNASIEQATEDIQKIGGVQAFKESYMKISFISLMKKRAGWLILLFVGELFTASAMGHFEEEIAKAVVLALFLPLIISSGGNAGSQASTLVIRAIALGEVTIRDWWKIMRREVFSGIFLGSILGLIGFFRVTLWSMFSTMYGTHWLLVALTICFSLIGVVLWGTLSGSMLPLLLKKCGFDPAVSSAPFVATLVDVTGIIIYFSVAILLLSGTLL